MGIKLRPLNLNKVQYGYVEQKILNNCQANKFYFYGDDLNAIRWYDKLVTVKREKTMHENSNKEFVEYQQHRLDTNDFEDTTNTLGQVITAEWKRDITKKSIEDYSSRKYTIVYHDNKYVYNYETKEKLIEL